MGGHGLGHLLGQAARQLRHGDAAGACRTMATTAPQASRGGGAIQISNAPEWGTTPQAGSGGVETPTIEVRRPARTRALSSALLLHRPSLCICSPATWRPLLLLLLMPMTQTDAAHSLNPLSGLLHPSLPAGGCGGEPSGTPAILSSHSQLWPAARAGQQIGGAHAQRLRLARRARGGRRPSVQCASAGPAHAHRGRSAG